ncbi:MAG: C45 family peptidase [Planctomycetes bacterium]|nr:C45 family peptidase [Planctomycetota bacterium]
MNRLVLLVAVCVFALPVRADEPKRFPEAKHGKGELRYIDTVPVLTLRGKPAEMGEQFGVLAIKNAPDIDGLHKGFLKDAGLEKRATLLNTMASLLKPNFPKHILTEVEAAAKSADRELSLLLFANTVADLSSGMGCSTIVVEKERSSTGSPIFGRNFDWLPTKGINEHTLVVVYKGEDKRAFAAVTVAPICGVISGMNDAGLSVTINEISIKESKDKPSFNWRGTPLLFAFRRVLEECGTVAEAEKLLRDMPRTTTCCMTICDKSGGCVFEVTPTNLEVRTCENGVTCCTNHFRSDKLCIGDKCWRYTKLAPLQAKDAGKLGVSEVFTELGKVQQGKHTLQSMIFEPGERVLHLAYGDGPATKLKLHKLELGKLFDEK